MPARRFNGAVLVLACAALAACGRGADTGATTNPNAPGQPGTGNPVEAAAPQQPDSMAGGSSGMKGSLPHPGASGGDAVPGATGRGAPEDGGRSQPPPPGTGTTGGLGGTAGLGMTGTFPPAGAAQEGSGPAAAPQGTTNRSGGGAAGAR